MTPETLILIAKLVTGEVEWQPVLADDCHRVVASIARGELAQAERADGQVITFVAAECVPDTLQARIEMTPPGYIGPCEVEGELM
jgi:hypothetical protein